MFSRRNRLNLSFGDIVLYIIFIVYGFASYPFPRVIGYPEYLIGFLLFVLLIYTRGYNAINILSRDVAIEVLVRRLIFLLLFFYPTFLYVVNQWDFVDFTRDLIPFIYLFLPLFFYKFGATSVNSLIAGLLTAGVCFSWRYFYESGFDISALGTFGFFDEKSYYSYDPSVTFSLVYSIHRLVFNRDGLLIKIFFALIAWFCFLALAGVTQRAPLGLAFITLLLGLFLSNKKISALIFISACVLFVLTYYGEFVLSAFDALQQKQYNYGDNNKFAEMFDAFFSLDTVASTLFGLGWGALFYSTAYDGYTSNSHMIFIYFLVKSGIIGLILIGIYFYHVSKSLKNLWAIDRNLFFSILSSLIVGLFFQPTYKTLSYGFLLLLLFLIVDARSKITNVRNFKD